LSHDFCCVPAAAGAAIGSTNPTKNGDFCVAPMEKEANPLEGGCGGDPMLVATARLLGAKPFRPKSRKTALKSK
jgi:hypothetical protein